VEKNPLTELAKRYGVTPTFDMTPFLAKIIVKDIKDGGNFSDGAGDVHKWTCPSKKRWLLIDCVHNRDVSGTLQVYVKSKDTRIRARLGFASAGTGISNSLGGLAPYDDGAVPVWLMEGDYLEHVFGATQSTLAYIYTRFFEFSVGELDT